MRGRAYGVVVNFTIVLWMVEVGHGMVFHLLWPQERWIHLGCGRGLCHASTPNPLERSLHMSFLRWLDWQRDTFILSTHPGVRHP
jgi:hypothetical protein